MRAARVIAGKLGDTEIVSMRCDPKDVSAAECEVVGFICRHKSSLTVTSH